MNKLAVLVSYRSLSARYECDGSVDTASLLKGYMSYAKVFGDIKLRLSHNKPTADEKKNYGFISKYDIYLVENNAHTLIGNIIQKYTGKLVKHPSSIPNAQHRERIWIYEYKINSATISSSNRTMNGAIAALIYNLKQSTEQCSTSNSQAAQL